jgi:hypothetical protein
MSHVRSRCAHATADALVLVGPDERLEQARSTLVECDRVEIEPDPALDAELAREQVGGRPAPVVPLEHEVVGTRAEASGPVAVVVAVEREQQPRAGAELDEIDARSLEGQKRGQDPPRPPHLVRLHRLLADEPCQQLALVVERGVDVVPACPAVEDEVVQPTEQPQR